MSAFQPSQSSSLSGSSMETSGYADDQLGVVGGHLVGRLLGALEGVGAARRRTRWRRRRARARCRRRAVKPALSIASTIRSSASRLLRQVGREAALVAEAGGEAALLQHRLQRVVDLGAPLQRLAEGRRADRRDHELLDVDAGVGVRAAVEDVHHRHRQHVGVRPADVAEQRQLGRLGGRLGHRERDAEDARWRRAGTCRACRRGRSAPGRPAAARWPRSRPAPGRSRRARRGRPSRRPCRRSASCRRRAARRPRTGRCSRRWAPRRARWCRRRARPRPRRWGCRASRGSRGRRRRRCSPRRCSFVRGLAAGRLQPRSASGYRRRARSRRRPPTPAQSSADAQRASSGAQVPRRRRAVGQHRVVPLAQRQVGPGRGQVAGEVGTST